MTALTVMAHALAAQLASHGITPPSVLECEAIVRAMVERAAEVGRAAAARRVETSA